MKCPCHHFARHRNVNLMRHYARVCARIVYPIIGIDVKVKALIVRCGLCDDGGRLNSMMCCCLDCATFGCLTHLKQHFETTNHCFGVSTQFGELYCLKCNDFIFDHAVEKIRRHFQNESARSLGLSLKYDWNPGRDEVRLLRKYAPLVHRIMPGGIRGLRGLVNIGNTCFMNCIIQALVHIPTLRDYFLTDQHSCRHGNQSLTNSCLMCEMTHLVQAFYNGNDVTYVPHRMLHLVWQFAKHLSGYEQHDAHEFFISAINALHIQSESESGKKDKNKCRCIIDRLFTGHLQSDLKCNQCGRSSTTVDPYWDISLQLNDYAMTHQETAARSSDHTWTLPERLSRSSDAADITPDDECFGTTRDSSMSSTSGTTSATSSVTEWTLEECLENFVKAERLDVGAAYACSRCGSNDDVKQLTLRKLPMVICFHLKRFEQYTTRRSVKKRRKIRGHVRFPEFLDMTPYTTAYRESCRRREKLDAESRAKLRQHNYPTRQRRQRASLSPAKRTGSRSSTTRPSSLRRCSSPTKRSARKSQSFSPPSRHKPAASCSPDAVETSTQKLAHLANRYTLMAVVNHSGTTDSGHYVCHIRHQQSDWYNCNDQIISRERIEDALNSEGYLLFYCKTFNDYDLF